MPSEPAAASSPTSGPAFYELRRAQWLRPDPAHPAPARPATHSAQPQHKHLDSLLNDPDKVHSPAGWKEGIRYVWQNLNGGRKLAVRMPLATVIKITQAAWINDKIWPKGQVAPPDDEIQ